MREHNGNGITLPGPDVREPSVLVKAIAVIFRPVMGRLARKANQPLRTLRK